jgi:hypothetical protein
MSLPSDGRSCGARRWRKTDQRRGVLQPEELFEGRRLPRSESSTPEGGREVSPEEILLEPIEDYH